VLKPEFDCGQNAALKGPLFHGCVRSAASAAYEVDDLEFVAIIEVGLGPAVAGDDVAIQFDGNAVGLHGEGFYQSGKSGNRGIEGSFFTVDSEFHDV
jgi:hypothetical protein